MLGLSSPTSLVCSWMCCWVPLHTHGYMQKLCTHITSSFSHPASDSTPTHPLLPSLMYQCLYKVIFLAASSSVSISLFLCLSTPPSWFFFLFEALWFEQRQNSERQVSSLFTAESSSLSWFLVLCDISTCDDLTSVVSRTSHCQCLLKERTSGLCARTEKHLHTHFV